MKRSEMHNFLKHYRKTMVLFSYSIHQLVSSIQAFLHWLLTYAFLKSFNVSKNVKNSVFEILS
jgi:uncharacterized protein YggT (Ycf19 family)